MPWTSICMMADSNFRNSKDATADDMAIIKYVNQHISHKAIFVRPSSTTNPPQSDQEPDKSLQSGNFPPSTYVGSILLEICRFT